MSKAAMIYLSATKAPDGLMTQVVFYASSALTKSSITKSKTITTTGCNVASAAYIRLV